MIIVKDTTNKEMISADFQGVEQYQHTYYIFLSKGYTIRIGEGEWDKLHRLFDGRYIHKEDK